MRNYLCVFIGGAAGGLLRVMTIRADNVLFIGGMDLTILLINIIGAFLLGMFLSGMARFKSVSPGMHLGIAVGLFGSFTTFSALSMEAVSLLQANDFVGLSLYIFASCVAGLIAADLGFRVGTGTSWRRIGQPHQIILGSSFQTNMVPIAIQDEEAED